MRGLVFSTARDGSALRVELACADPCARDAFDEAFAAIHEEALRGGVREVVVDLRRLESITSPCFKSFVDWIAWVQQLEEPKRYAIRLLSTPRFLWQRRAVNALRFFALDLVTVEVARPQMTGT